MPSGRITAMYEIHVANCAKKAGIHLANCAK